MALKAETRNTTDLPTRLHTQLGSFYHGQCQVQISDVSYRYIPQSTCVFLYPMPFIFLFMTFFFLEETRNKFLSLHPCCLYLLLRD